MHELNEYKKKKGSNLEFVQLYSEFLSKSNFLKDINKNFTKEDYEIFINNILNYQNCSTEWIRKNFPISQLQQPKNEDETKYAFVYSKPKPESKILSYEEYQIFLEDGIQERLDDLVTKLPIICTSGEYAFLKNKGDLYLIKMVMKSLEKHPLK